MSRCWRRSGCISSGELQQRQFTAMFRTHDVSSATIRGLWSDERCRPWLCRRSNVDSSRELRVAPCRDGNEPDAQPFSCRHCQLDATAGTVAGCPDVAGSCRFATAAHDGVRRSGPIRAPGGRAAQAASPKPAAASAGSSSVGLALSYSLRRATLRAGSWRSGVLLRRDASSGCIGAISGWPRAQTETGIRQRCPAHRLCARRDANDLIGRRRGPRQFYDR